MSDDSRYPEQREGKFFQAMVLAAVLLASAVALGYNSADPDLWGHVRYGRDLLADGLPTTTTYSYTAEGYRWINHENLSEIVFAVGADTFGPVGLLILKCLLGLMLVGFMLRNASRQGIGLVAAGGVILLASLVIGYRWAVRPQLLSYTYFGMMLALLAWCFEGWEGRWHFPQLRWRKVQADEFVQVGLSYSPLRMRMLWLSVPLFFVWANSHGGFAAGFLLFAAYLILRSAEALATRGRAGWGLVRRFALMIGASAAATFVNPYGPGLHAWMLESLGSPRPEITEWWPPNLWDFTDTYIVSVWIALIVFAAAAVLSKKSRDLTHFVLLGLTLWQSLEHQRHLPFFAILFGFWMPVHVESLMQRLSFEKDNKPFGADMSPKMRWVMAGALLLAFVLLFANLKRQLSDMPVPKEHFPVAAIQFVEERELTGNMVVTYNWAQYAIAALAPDSPEDDGVLVSFDGRFRTCYPQEIVDMNFDFLIGNGKPSLRNRGENSGPVDTDRVLEFGDPNLVLISRAQEPSVKVMEENEDEWVLLYQDSISQVWGARWVYDSPNSPDYLPPSLRHVTDDVQEGSVSWPAFPVTSDAVATR